MYTIYDIDYRRDVSLYMKIWKRENKKENCERKECKIMRKN